MKHPRTRILATTIATAVVGIILLSVFAFRSETGVAQDTDADRIAALESQVATQVAINWQQSDRIAELVGDMAQFAPDNDRLLPPPRPASDFGASQFNAGSLSDAAVTLYCRAQDVAQGTYVALTCDQVVYP
jgi:hypothetical protein